MDGTGGIWLAGRSGSHLVVSHYDGKAWHLLGEPLALFDGASTWRETILGGSAANDLWVVAPDGMRHWDGATWTLHDAPIHRPVQMLVRSPTDIWLLDFERAVRWDGTSWEAVALPPDALPSVAVDVRQFFSAPGGALWLTTATGTFIRDGEDWKALDLASGYLVHVARNGAQFIVDKGYLRRLHEGGHADFRITNERLLSAMETSTGEVVFLVAKWPIEYSLVRWDGARFVRTSLEDIIPSVSAIALTDPDGTLHADAGGIWLRTRYGTLRRQEDGEWREIQSAYGEHRHVHGDYSADGFGHIYRWDGVRWLLEFHDPSRRFSRLWHAGDEVWVVDPRGYVVRKDAGTWVEMPAVRPDPYWSDVVVENGRAWIASFERPSISHWDGSRWHAESMDGSQYGLAIADGTTWATTTSANEGGRLYRRGANAWSEGVSLPNGSWGSVFATGANEAWVIAGEPRLIKWPDGSGSFGAVTDTLLRTDGSTWETVLQVESGDVPVFRGIAGTPDGPLWLGAGDALYQIDRHGGAPVRHSLPGRAGAVAGMASDGSLWLRSDLGLARWMPPE